MEMKHECPSPPLHSIADIATASWYAHRASTPPRKTAATPRIKKSPSSRLANTRTEVPTSDRGFGSGSDLSDSDSDSDSGSASDPASGSAPLLAAPASPDAPAADDASAVAPTTELTTSHNEDAVQPSAEISIFSDITAWQSAQQTVPPVEPPAFKSPLEFHPLIRVLANQPTLRRVEWNQYRLAGTFKPRTAYDYSSLLIYISGQVNPNPCRNCVLRNGPFAQCVTAPPSVLALGGSKHACANCTYQNQHRKCINDATSEPFIKTQGDQSDLRNGMKARHVGPKTANARAKHAFEREKKKERIRRERELQRTQGPFLDGQQGQHEKETGLTQEYLLKQQQGEKETEARYEQLLQDQLQQIGKQTDSTHGYLQGAQQEQKETEMQWTHEHMLNGHHGQKEPATEPAQEQLHKEPQSESRGNRSVSPPLAVVGFNINGVSFDDKLQHIRTLSPRSRKKMAAEVLQWQAALATIEATDVYTFRGPEHKSRLGVVMDHQSSSNSTPRSSDTASGPALAKSAAAGMSYDEVDAYDRMDEDVPNEQELHAGYPA